MNNVHRMTNRRRSADGATSDHCRDYTVLPTYTVRYQGSLRHRKKKRRVRTNRPADGKATAHSTFSAEKILNNKNLHFHLHGDHRNCIVTGLVSRKNTLLTHSYT